mmetsp:Transcript_23496/g.39863  ORF Transcript_23496/g.39863 Transcript_23496/m.39863 type:complete len:276 (-) Transcript_23496:344-1171(-)
MNLSQASSEGELAAESEDDQIFSCRIENAKVVTDILSAIHAGGKDNVCEVKASARAVVFSVLGRGKNTQARATMQAGLFEEFIFESGQQHESSGRAEGGMHFCINLTTLLDCLLLFGSTSESTAATLTYSSLDALFKISLEEAGVLTTCELVTLERDDVYAGNVTAEEARSTTLYAQFREHPEACRFILKAEPLRDAIQDMCDVLSGGDVTFHAMQSPEEMLKLSLKGSLDLFEVEFPKSSSAFVMFECLSETRWAYFNAAIQLGMKVTSMWGER